METSGQIESWDQATQRYLATGRLASGPWISSAIGTIPPRREELIRLRNFLQYPADYDSPRQFNPNASPRSRSLAGRLPRPIALGFAGTRMTDGP